VLFFTNQKNGFEVPCLLSLFIIEYRPRNNSFCKPLHTTI
jgi:hypothetical protein